MKLAVKFYKDYSHPKEPKPEGIPDEWPWVCRECEDEKSELDLAGDGYVLMSLREFAYHKEIHQEAYDAYAEKFIPKPVKPLPLERELARALYEDMRAIAPNGAVCKLLEGCFPS